MCPIRGKNPVMDFKHWLLRIQEIKTLALKALDTSEEIVYSLQT